MNHHSYLEYNSLVKLSKVKTCKLIYLLKTVNKSVSVNKKLS